MRNPNGPYVPDGTESGEHTSPSTCINGEWYWHCWRIPREMQKDEAYDFWKRHVRPKGFKEEKFQYNPHTGEVRAL